MSKGEVPDGAAGRVSCGRRTAAAIPPTGSPTLFALLRVYLDIALLRRGPQVLPASGLLLALVTLACLASTAAVLVFLAPDGASLTRATVIELLLDAVGLWLVLAVARRSARYPQVLSAVYGTGTILNLALLPVVALVAVDVPRFELIGAFAAMLLLAWGMSILAHILHHALELPLGLTLLVAALFVFLSLVARRLVGID